MPTREPERTAQEVTPSRLGLRKLPGFVPEWGVRARATVEEARNSIARALTLYINNPAPAGALLIVSSAGTGKTWQAVKFAYEVANMYVIDPDNLAEGYAKRVFFGGQRHNALPDLLTAAESQGKDPNMFLEWLPRQTKEEKDLSTCRYEGSIGQWMHKGYAGRKFCEGVCREDYIKICPYHQQKARPEPIVFGQHAHLVLGHPLMDQCSVFIGDENPMSIFPQTWAIPQRFIYTQAMDWEEPLVEMLFSIQGLLDQPDLVLRGPELLAALGGPQKVYELCRDFVLPAESLLTPTVRRPEDVERIEYNFLPEFVPMLQREAEAALTGRPYIDRIKLGKGVLELSTRRKVDKSVPSHLIWFDATGEQKFYEAMFERPVEVVDAVPDFVGRVWQVHDKLNGCLLYTSRCV